MRIFVTAIAVLFLIGTVPGQAQDAPRHVSVEGVGRVSAVPDMAVVRLGVQREARDAGSAMTAASEAMTVVLEQIESAGIAPEDVQTTRIGLDPRWQHSETGAPPRITGYVATNSLSVTIRELGDLGGLLDAVVADGANTMNGLSFEISETGSLEDAARVAAVEDARRKAGLLAEAAGAELGDVISIAEGTQGGGPAPMFEAALSDRAAAPVAAGQLEIVVTVRAVFGLEG